MPVVLVLLVVAGLVSAQQGWLTGDRTSSASPGPGTAAQTGAGTASAAGSDPTASTSAPSTSAPSTSAPSSSTAADRRRLADCRTGVSATDRVLGAADVGLGHWAEDIETQKDAHAGRITAGEMVAAFDRTRLAGPADVARYEKAVRRDGQLSSSCDSTSGTAAATRARLATCRQRASAQQPVLAAARQSMADREAYLRATGGSRPSRRDDVQASWIRATPAAAPHVVAYQQAANRFHAPAC